MDLILPRSASVAASSRFLRLLLEHLAVADHRRERRAQPVAHVGEEGALGLVGVLGRLLGRGERGLRRLAFGDVGQQGDHAEDDTVWPAVRAEVGLDLSASAAALLEVVLEPCLGARERRFQLIALAGEAALGEGLRQGASVDPGDVVRAEVEPAQELLVQEADAAAGVDVADHRRAIQVVKNNLVELDHTSLLRATADTLPHPIQGTSAGRARPPHSASQVQLTTSGSWLSSQRRRTTSTCSSSPAKSTGLE